MSEIYIDENKISDDLTTEILAQMSIFLRDENALPNVLLVDDEIVPKINMNKIQYSSYIIPNPVTDRYDEADPIFLRSYCKYHPVEDLKYFIIPNLKKITGSFYLLIKNKPLAEYSADKNYPIGFIKGYNDKYNIIPNLFLINSYMQSIFSNQFERMFDRMSFNFFFEAYGEGIISGNVTNKSYINSAKIYIIPELEKYYQIYKKSYEWSKKDGQRIIKTELSDESFVIGIGYDENGRITTPFTKKIWR